VEERKKSRRPKDASPLAGAKPAPINRMRILVIGGTRFIGPHLVHQAVQSGHQVTVYHRGRTEAVLAGGVEHYHSEFAGIPVRKFPADLLRRDFDAVVHMVAMGQEDARAAAQAFRGRVRRIVWLSSGDVYRAYGRFTQHEPGPIEPGPLTEDSPVRTLLYPYRERASSQDHLEYYYDKLLVEQAALADEQAPSVVLRLPKVYGQGDNADLATVCRYRHHPQWRWTHGYVENVSAAILLAVTCPAVPSRIYNVGEEHTPTVAERLADLPPSKVPLDTEDHFNFEQDIVYDTSRIRRELSHSEPVPYLEGLRRTLLGAP